MYIKVSLKNPLKLDVKSLVQYFPDFRYGESQRNKTDKYNYECFINQQDDHNCVIGFDDRNEDGFNTIMTNYSPKELANYLSVLPEDIRNLISEALKGTKAELPTLSEADIKQIQEIKDRKAAEHAIIKKANDIGQKADIGLFSAEDAQAIGQHELGYTDAYSDKPIIATYGAGPCIILSIYNRSNRTAALMHIDGLTDLKSINQAFYQLNPDQKEILEAHLAGGQATSKDMAIKLLQMLETNNVKLVSCKLNIDTYSTDSESLAIDARNGQICNDFDAKHQLTFDKDFNVRMELVGLRFCKNPIAKSFDGRGRNKDQEKPIQTKKISKSSDDQPSTPLRFYSEYNLSNLTTEIGSFKEDLDASRHFVIGLNSNIDTGSTRTNYSNRYTLGNKKMDLDTLTKGKFTQEEIQREIDKILYPSKFQLKK